MNALMDRKLTTLAIADSTLLAYERSFPSMGIDMLLVVLLGTETFAAKFAHVLALLQVNKCVMPLHVEAVGVLLSAVRAERNQHPRFHFFTSDMGLRLYYQ